MPCLFFLVSHRFKLLTEIRTYRGWSSQKIKNDELWQNLLVLIKRVYYLYCHWLNYCLSEQNLQVCYLMRKNKNLFYKCYDFFIQFSFTPYISYLWCSLNHRGYWYMSLWGSTSGHRGNLVTVTTRTNHTASESSQLQVMLNRIEYSFVHPVFNFFCCC